MSDLDAIAERVARGPGFDVAPGAVSARPDPELDALLAALGDDDVPALRDRLERERDPFMALVWARALLTVATPAAQAALDDCGARLESADPWPGAFPGAGEVLRLIGR